MAQLFSSIWTGISLQLLFFILYFGTILPKLNNVFGAAVCIIIGIFGFINGLFSMKNHNYILTAFRKKSPILKECEGNIKVVRNYNFL